MTALGKAIAKGYKATHDGVTKLYRKVTGKFGMTSNELIASGDDVGRVAVNVADAVNDRQKSVLNQWKDNIGDATNAQKGNYGEMATDLDLAEKGYIPLHQRIDNIDAPGHQGIDAVMEKNGEYFIVESKYSSTSTPSLNAANLSTGLPKQMSDDWIRQNQNERLINVLDGDIGLADQIASQGYTRVVATHGPNGNKIYKLVDSAGNIGNTWTP